MDKSLLLGIWRLLLPIPRPLWQGEVAKDAGRTESKLDFMTADHHRVRNFVVRELPRLRKPIPPALIAEQLGLPGERVGALLDDLERHLTFLYRNAQGEVAWAYPVTAAKTPHRVIFSTGEQIYAA
jgi:hypothetical protein